MNFPFQKSQAIFSPIVKIGEDIRKVSKKTGKEFLLLNRGITAVTPIDLSQVIPLIDFNSNEIQVYPPVRGSISLKKAINQSYFNNEAELNQILITGGGMMGLDLLFQTVDVKRIYLPLFFWGSYNQILTIRGKTAYYYESYEAIEQNIDKYPPSVFVICDPNNPIGDKYDDEKLFQLIKKINDTGHIVIWDSPYRMLFCDETDSYFNRLFQLKNVIINESFSKSLGLSGQRLGFVANKNPDFMEELSTRLMYATNGINGFAQKLVELLLTSSEGKKVVKTFKTKTVKNIRENINFLKKNKLLATEFYNHSTPTGIFVIVNKTQEQLMEHYIGSVSLGYFTKQKSKQDNRFARINVAVPSAQFSHFFKSL